MRQREKTVIRVKASHKKNLLNKRIIHKDGFHNVSALRVDLPGGDEEETNIRKIFLF